MTARGTGTVSAAESRISRPSGHRRAAAANHNARTRRDRPVDSPGRSSRAPCGVADGIGCARTAARSQGIADESLAVSEDRNALSRISFGFFIPVYFALIGIQLDLIHYFDPVFFLGFLGFACIAKAASVYLGAWLSREDRFMCWSLAVAMNARGGPGIVLASTAFAAGIINETFFVSLVMLSVVTSLLAGSWLERTASPT